MAPGPPAPFALFETETFSTLLAGLPTRERNRISRKVVDLAADPYRNTKLLQNPYAGHRRFRVGDYRIIFTVCGECRSHEFQDKVGCQSCPGKPDRTVTLRFVGARGGIYDR